MNCQRKRGFSIVKPVDLYRKCCSKHKLMGSLAEIVCPAACGSPDQMI